MAFKVYWYVKKTNINIILLHDELIMCFYSKYILYTYNLYI